MPTNWGEHGDWNSLNEFGIHNSKNNLFDFGDLASLGLTHSAGQNVDALNSSHNDYLNIAKTLIGLGTAAGRAAATNQARQSGQNAAGSDAQRLLEHLRMLGVSGIASAGIAEGARQRAGQRANNLDSYYASPEGQIATAQAAQQGQSMIADDPLIRLMYLLKNGQQYSNRGGLTLGGLIQSGINAYGQFAGMPGAPRSGTPPTVSPTNQNNPWYNYGGGGTGQFL